MRSNKIKSGLVRSALASVLVLASTAALSQVNLTAAPTTLTLPDGNSVPMWGYSCGAAGASGGPTCAQLNQAGSGWSPVVITAPAGQDLTINLTNNLTFGPNSIPTSLVIVGQLGGGLGDVTQRTTTASPDHSGAQGTTTWPIAGTSTGITAPAQGQRVRSFATEVGAGNTTSLTWKVPRPGTYLIESGTHPSIQGPMGLYGIVVVTTAPAGATPGTAYPGVTYNAEVPLLFSEIDPAQNAAVNAAVNTAGFLETNVWSGQAGNCGDPASPSYNTCYPPVVNYTPLYYTINGVAFDTTHPSASLFPTAPATGVTGNVLVRLVNAGLRMHVPSIVGAQTGAGSASGFSLIAEDGNALPGVPRVQSEVFMAAGKTYDVMINGPADGSSAAALPIYDRELSLSANAVARDAGMLAYVNINGASLAPAPAAVAVARPDTYGCATAPCALPGLIGGQLTISDPAKGVVANDSNVNGVQLVGSVAGLTLNPNGTFSYSGAPTTFTYCANGTVTGGVCSSGITATVTLNAAPLEAASGITCGSIAFSSTTANFISVKTPGVLATCKDAAGYPLTLDTTSVTGGVIADANGGFTVTTGVTSFSFQAMNSQGTRSAAQTAYVTYPPQSGLAVTVLDGSDKTPIADYRWIIEEDRTFYVNPACTTNPPPAGCPGTGSGIVPTFGTNFHTSYMPVVATGCTGPLSCESGQSVQGTASVCDVGNGACRPGDSQAIVMPNQVHLDPNKRYYISVLPGDAANPFISGWTKAPTGASDGTSPTKGHGMGGAPIATGQSAVTIYTQPTPLPPAKLSVFVYEDDFPLNGEQDGGGGIDVLSPNEPGLGGFNITLFDDAGGPGDATGQMTYDMFNMPLSNSLAGTIDPATGLDACPISPISRKVVGQPTSPTGITGTIVTCPKYESNGTTLSPLAGQAVVANLMPGRYGVVATPAADRIARGEEWLQTNTLDGQKAHDSFLRVAEPGYFQEYGPAGFHVSIGFANPKIINSRLAAVCNGSDPTITGNCSPGNTVTGTVTTERMSRTPDERLYSSGDNSSFAFTQCYVSIGDPDGEDFAFAKCDAKGQFTVSGLPDGDWRITVFDQWNDMLVDGLSTPVRLGSTTSTCPGNGSTQHQCNMGDIAMNQWQANIYTKTFFDQNHNGVRDANESGLTLVPTNIRFRDGSYSNFNNTDLSGNAGFNEVFPLFNWYVIETDTTRYKSTGTHVVYDAGGPADGCASAAGAPCGSSVIAGNMANTYEAVPVPSNLRVPGSFYCANADCSDAPSPLATGGSGGSTGRVDPGIVHPYGSTYGWQGFSGQNSFLEFGKAPFAETETGGIHGEVIYASTRPFDDPALLIHTSWTPDVPGVTVNLYQEGTAPDGTTSLTLVDTTKTSSWDDWAQGFRSDGMPNMNCPGQGRDTGTDADLFFFTLFNQPMWLDAYKNGGTPAHTVPNNSQFKCYDGMHNWNQLQPAPYDGMYQFPSVLAINPATGKPQGTNCTVCVSNPDSNDPLRAGTPMLPAGKYVVEIVVPPGYELVKEEDKNILIGDNYIAPVTQQFGALGNIFILPDQAEVASLYNSNNPQNPTVTFGRTTLPSHEGDTGSVETFWPCVGEARIVPDFISLFPKSQEVAPFAGAKRNLCDRKEVTLDYQTSALAKFWIFTSAHAAAHFTGVITDDFTSEFDPFSPQFGEKFSPANLPISIKDWTGQEISRVYADQWGTYNGLTYSTWEVNPPNPTGYAPQMMVTCMNDPGTGPTPDALFNPAYSQFCYEIPFMPGQTQYMDTPVIPVSAFAGAGYNNPDCAYPDATPAIKSVVNTSAETNASGTLAAGTGPWVSAPGVVGSNGLPTHGLTITALGDAPVNNYGYAGPSVTTAPFNQKTVTRHYGFGATKGTVTIGGITVPSASITTWNDTTIVLAVPSGIANCAIQQQTQYGGSAAQCGELVITAANGKQSIDAINVTVGGKAPKVLAAGQTIQAAIDAAQPGDMIIVPSGSYHEILLMWKPIRLQGVGAASSIINANTHPAGKLDPWRRQVNCLFGLSISGTVISGTNPYDPTGTYTCPAAMRFQVDRLPLEATVGWDATLNGNLAEQLQEPTLMGALEGAAITVLSKGVKFPAGSNPFAADTFPVGTTLLIGSSDNNVFATGDNNSNCRSSRSNTTNPFPSNFQCNPSRIDGLGITNSSQGGGAIFVHGWAHNLEISNNRIVNNTGTLSGGINLGQGEHPEAYLGGAGTANADPGSCQTSNTTNLQLPYCFNVDVNVHHNSISLNSSTGDELFSSTPAGSGGVSICTGADYYKFNYNWVCGNLSTGDGGGAAHVGFSYNGDIEHNTFLFNQSTNPTIATNGGGLLIMGAPDSDPTCGSTTDTDCIDSTVTPSDGTGPNLMINANLILGNGAEAGSGGGLRIQHANGSDVISFPANPERWNSVTIQNNVISNNVAGWDGAGVSLLDALNVNIINNTIMSNDTTASSGVLFDTLGAPLASSSGVNCMQSTTASCPQPAGLVSVQNSAVFAANLPAQITCPVGHGVGGSGSGTNAGRVNGQCRYYSVPLLDNDVIWQNRAFYIGVGSLGTGTLNQQHVVALYTAFTSALAPSQPKTDATTANGNGSVISGGTGACVNPSTAPNYWEIGVRGDTGPSNHTGSTRVGLAAAANKLFPTYSVLTDAADYTGLNNSAGNPTVLSQYCNGSRVPPELGSMGYQVPPGISDATVPNPIFNLTPAATVDEGNNWINISWGPLSLVNPTTNAVLGNYGPASGSSVIGLIPSTANGANGAYTLAPSTDFYGNARKTDNSVDAGAVEYVVPANTPIAGVTGGPLAFGNVLVGTTSAPQTLTLHNTGTASVTTISVVVTAPFSRPGAGAGGTCGATLVAAATCTINIVYSPTATAASTGSVTITSNVAVAGSPVSLSGTGVAATHLATVSPASLAFGNWATGTTSRVQTLTVTNTGNSALAGGTFNYGGGTGYARATGGAAGNCGATLAVGASCTYGVVFSPTATGPANRTLTVAYTGATVTGSPVALTGSGVATRAAVTVTPLTITVPSGLATGTGVVTLTNNSAAGGSQVLVNSAAITAGGLLNGGGLNYNFLVAADTCTGNAVAPGASCTVTVRFTNLLAARPGTHAGTLTFSDSGAGSPQPAALTGIAN